jgi:phosphatidylinositol alpha-1,6-mannosyltransferase
MSRPESHLFGVFPAFDCEQFGGVQASGRMAWDGVLAEMGAQHSSLLSHEPGSSRASTVLKAIQTRRRAKVILVWHLQLLKLIPFLNTSSARVVLFLHGIEAWKRHDPLTRFTLGKVTLFLSNSDHTWNRFLLYYPEFKSSQHRTVHLGLGAVADEETRTPSHRPVALMIGRLLRSEDYKGHRQMINAWPLVRKGVPNSELWIVGDGDLRRDLEKAASIHGANSGVRFWGAVSDAEKEELVRQCRCLALPSSGEGFGLVYLEAMRAGRPCLVSTADAGQEVVNPPEAGLAANPENPEELAAAVLRLIAPAVEWNAWSTQARHRYEDQFTAHHFHKRLLAALSES